MHSLVIFSHQGHHFVSLGQVLVMFGPRGLRLFNQCSLFLLELCRVTSLDKSHVIHLVLHLGNVDFRVVDISFCFPVLEDSNQVFLSSL